MPLPRLPGLWLGPVVAALVLVPFLRSARRAPRPRRPRPAIVAAGASARTATRPDGSARTELPWLLPGDRDPAVSPDGSRLAFSSARTGNQRDLRRRRVERRRAAADREPQARRPAPRLVARRSPASPGRAAPPAAGDVYVMRADGTRKRLVAGGPGDDVDPAWSPDGATHRLRLDSRRRSRPLGGARVAVASPSCSSTPQAPRGRRPGARMASASRSARTAKGAHATSGSHRSPRSSPRRITALAPDRPATGLVAGRHPPRVHALASRPHAHLGRPRAATGRQRPVAGTDGRPRPGLVARLAVARARPRAAAPRPRPARADRPGRARQAGRVPPRLHLRRGQHRTRAAPHPRLAAARPAHHARRPADRAARRRRGHRARRGHAPLPDASATPALALPAVRELRAPPRVGPCARRPRPQERLLPHRPLRARRPAACRTRGRRGSSRTAAPASATCAASSRARRPATSTATRRSSTARTSTSRASRPVRTSSCTAPTRPGACASRATRTTPRPCGCGSLAGRPRVAPARHRAAPLRGDGALSARSER